MRMDKASLKAGVCAAIDARSAELIYLGRQLQVTPELGYKEYETAALVTEAFDRLGLDYRTGLALTGVRADLAGAAAGPTVAVLGELDALLCHGHPDADPQTGATHNCGHHAQVAAMVGVGVGLLDAGAMAHLAGRVVLFAVPAEEYVELEYRSALREAGKIEFLGGKPELVRLGEFDDVDLAMLVHSMANVPARAFAVGGSMNGFLAKVVHFAGRAAHAGARPDLGVNALNAAALAIMGIHAQRETFREEDTIRVHFIMSKGGDLVNVVPDDVRLELFVRARSLESILETSGKVDRALQGGATMVGATVDIEDLPGYLPLVQDHRLADTFRQNAKTLIGIDGVWPGGHVTACTDMGDLSHLMPVIQPGGGGYEGLNHSVDFRVADEEMAYVLPAKAMAMTVVDLLYDDAQLGRSVVDEFEPKMTKAEYLAYLRGERRADACRSTDGR
jgi:amidohydrolase